MPPPIWEERPYQLPHKVHAEMGNITRRTDRDLAALDQDVREYLRVSRRPATWRGYEGWWRRFNDFIAPRDAWNAKPADVARCVLAALKTE